MRVFYYKITMSSPHRVIFSLSSISFDRLTISYYPCRITFISRCLHRKLVILKKGFSLMKDLRSKCTLHCAINLISVTFKWLNTLNLFINVVYCVDRLEIQIGI